MASMLGFQLLTDLLNTEHQATIAAYYQTNGAHPAAMERVLHLFEQHYSPHNIYLHNDGGTSRLHAVARLHRISNYSYTISKGSIAEKGMYFNTAESATLFIERVTKAAQAADWLLLLEDDVWLHGPIKTDDLKYDVNSDCTHFFNTGLANWLRPHSWGWVCYGGAGGAIIRSSRLLASNYTIQRVAEIMHASDREDIASDELISAIILMSGGTIGSYEGFTKYIYRPGIMVQHEAKSLY